MCLSLRSGCYDREKLNVSIGLKMKELLYCCYQYIFFSFLSLSLSFVLIITDYKLLRYEFQCFVPYLLLLLFLLPRQPNLLLPLPPSPLPHSEHRNYPPSRTFSLTFSYQTLLPPLRFKETLILLHLSLPHSFIHLHLTILPFV